MQIFLRNLSGKTRTFDVRPSDKVSSLKQHIAKKEGIPPSELLLTYEGKLLQNQRTIADYGIPDQASMEIALRLRGGKEILVRIRPRVQKETWSLYWKESMHTNTECLDDFEMNIDDSVSVGDLQRQIAENMKWQPVESLLRLEGFNEDWQRMVTKGRELPEKETLAQCGIQTNTVLTSVRKELIAEGWAIHVDDDDISTSDESDI